MGIVVKPILFNTEMVRAILDGRKTVTRRVVKPQPEMALAYIWGGHKARHWGYSPYDEENYAKYRYSSKYWTQPCNADDILWVRETWAPYSRNLGLMPEIHYRADGDNLPGVKWRPSIHMPKEAARIWLRVTNVRVEQVRDILKDPPGPNNQVVREGCRYTCDFIATWENTIKKADKGLYGWDANPWVWVIAFERCEKPNEV